MKTQSLDDNAIKFIQAHADVHIVHIYPAIKPEFYGMIEDEIRSRSEIYFKKTFKFTRGGLINCKKISYDRQGFGGGFTDHFRGYRKHAKKSIGGSSRRTNVFVVCGSLESMRELKNGIREKIGRGSWPIHITDSHEEAIILGNIYFNDNALTVYNGRSYLFDSSAVDKLVDDFKDKVLKMGLSLNDVCLAGSVPMAICGIRPCKDCDYLSTDERVYALKDNIYSPHDSQLRRYPASKNDIIKNPKWHFVYRGVKVISLEGCLRLKIRRHGWPKDYKDILRITWFYVKLQVKHLLANVRFMGFNPPSCRERMINALNRFCYLGRGVSFVEYCNSRGIIFNHDIYRKLLASRPIVRIESCRVPVGKLKTSLFGEKYLMRDSIPYKAMCGEQKYSDYTDKIQNHLGYTSSRENDYATKILKKIEKEGFDPKCPIIVNNKNFIIDGQHRSCCMLKLRGPDYQIPALRIYTLPTKGSLVGRLFGIRPKAYMLP